MFCKHIKYDNNGNEIAKGPQCRYAEEFRFHIRGTDNTGAYKQCHYPQTHNNISCYPSKQIRYIFSGMEIEIHPCLTFHLTLQNVCQQCRDIYGLSKRAIQCFAAAF